MAEVTDGVPWTSASADDQSIALGQYNAEQGSDSQTLDDLQDVDLTDLQVGDYISFDGTKFVRVASGGGEGVDGLNGWSPVLALAADGERRVLQVADWTGGSGSKPATGSYIGPAGLTAVIGDAVDVRGDSEASNAVLNSLYDAHSILVANTNDTPEALPVGAATVVGRDVTGDIAALTVAELKTLLSLAKADVGLGSADNTADTAKPVSTAQQTALDAKQPLDNDLTVIAALTPTDDDVLQRKAGAWTNRTLAQIASDLGVTTENLQDLVGAMVAGNTESGGTLTYDDTNGKLDLSVNASSAVPQQSDLLRPSVYLGQTFDRRFASTSITPTSGRLYAVAYHFTAGQVVTALTFLRANAIGTPTNQWFALLDASYNLVANTTDDAAAAWNNVSTKRLVMTPSAYTIPTTGVYYKCIMVAASTIGTLQGTQGSTALSELAPKASFVSTQTGITNVASLTSPVVPAAFSSQPWAAFD